MKYLVVFVLVAAVATGGIIWYVRDAKGATDPNSAQQTAKVERGTLRVSVATTGAVASNKDVDIKCRASGEVKELPYDISDNVKPTALLLRLDTRDEDRALDQANAVLSSDTAKVAEAELAWQVAKLNLVTMRQRAEASLASAVAKANDADAKTKRTSELFDQKLSSKEELETAQTTAALAHADMDTAKAALAELDQQKINVDVKEHDIALAKAQESQDKVKAAIAQDSVDYCKVWAPPMDDNPNGLWTVSALTVQIGTLVQSGTSNVSGGSAVMTLSDLSHIFVLALVQESDIGQVAIGQNVLVTCDSYKGKEFRGKVVRIATKGVSTSNVVTFEVKVEVTSRNRLLLKPMMTANVEIVSTEKPDVTMVPVQAVSLKHADPSEEPATAASTGPANDTEPAAATSPDDAAVAATSTAPTIAHHRPDPVGPFPATVHVVKDDGSLEKRDIKVGINDGANYEVLDGLEAGETVVLNKPGADSKFHAKDRSASRVARIGSR